MFRAWLLADRRPTGMDTRNPAFHELRLWFVIDPKPLLKEHHGKPMPGTYTWFVKDKVLDFTQLDDRCNDRRDQVMIALFYPEGTAP